MKLVLKIFNIIIMTIALVASVFLFVSPTFSLNSNVALNIKGFSGFIPTTEYTNDIDLAKYLGTEEIHVGVSFSLRITDMNKIMSGDRDTINEKIISKSMDDVVNTLREPIDLITDIAIKENLKNLVEQQITSYVDQARQKYMSDKSLEDILSDVGMDDAYFTNFSLKLYEAACADDATVLTIGDLMFDQIDEAMAMADDSHAIDSSEFNEETKEDAQVSMRNVLKQLGLLEEDGLKVKKLNNIAYIYLGDFLKKQLDGKVSGEELIQKVGESDFDYSDRLLRLFVYEVIPSQVYQGIGIFGVACLVAIFVFAAVWILLFVLTLIRTFSSKKPYTKFGFWFWLIGPLQLILGLVITIAGKFILPRFSLSNYGLPLGRLYVVPRTFALVPSILFLVCIVIGIVYAVLRNSYKSSMKEVKE